MFIHRLSVGILSLMFSSSLAHAQGFLLYQKNGAAAQDGSGRSVASAGDVNRDGKADFIVGAFNAAPRDLNGSGAGAASVYSGANGTLLYQKSGAVAGDLFGFSVAGAGDVNGDGFSDFIVGAHASDGGAGAAFVYSGATGALLYEKHGVAGDLLGYSVASAGDVNGDGKSDFIVGAPFASPGGFSFFNAGSVYVYSGATGAVLYQKDGAAAGDLQGYCVGSAGDVNNDGKADFIIGAPQAHIGSFVNNVGAAYVYSGADGALLYEKDGAATGDLFGTSVASAGDVNGDSRNDFIVGCNNAAPGGRTSAGSAFIYSGSTGGLLYQKDGAVAGDNFGYSVGAAGDVNNDGKADVIIGANSADPGGRNSAGRVYVYSGSTGSELFHRDGSAAGDQLGISVAAAGDVNGDGKSDVIMGASGASPAVLPSAGSAYVVSAVDPTVAVQEEVVTESGFALSALAPNPARGHALLSYVLPRTSAIRLSLFDIRGREVALLWQGERSAGAHHEILDSSHIASGIYFLRLNAPGVRLQRRVVILD
jgi:hypothetical protein